jgi:hypothetical protein
VIVSLRAWVAVGVLISGLSLAGLWYLVTRTQPTDMMQAVFLVLVALALIGLTILIAAYLNHRFARLNWLRKDPLRLVREGVSVALFGVLCAWLQKENQLDLVIAAIIGGVLALTETFFLTRGKE